MKLISVSSLLDVNCMLTNQERQGDTKVEHCVWGEGEEKTVFNHLLQFSSEHSYCMNQEIPICELQLCSVSEPSTCDIQSSATKYMVTILSNSIWTGLSLIPSQSNGIILKQSSGIHSVSNVIGTGNFYSRYKWTEQDIKCASLANEAKIHEILFVCPL
jgi:hypothetical protein